MEIYSSSAFFVLNFAMRKGNKTYRNALYDRLIQRQESPFGRGTPFVTQSVAKSDKKPYEKTKSLTL